MWYGLVTLALFAFTFYCLLDVVLSDEREIRHLPKVAWALLVALLVGIGGLLWLYAGRPPRSGTTPGGGTPAVSGDRPGPNPRGPHPSAAGRRGDARGGGPKGPDDDPDFLRRLDERLRRRDDRDG